MPALLRLNPLIAPVLRRILGEVKPEVETIQSEEIEVVRPPVLLPGMLDRVTDTDEHSVLSYHLTAAQETAVTHASVQRRIYRNALVRRSGFATWRQHERYPSGLELSELAGPILRVPELRYCHNFVSWQYFGHWLTDALPSALIDPELGDLWMPPHPDWGHAPDYIDALGFSILDAPLVQADRLIAYQDFGQGSHKRGRYAAIRDMLHARFGGGDGADCVYIRRGRTGAPRWIADEAALVDSLAARNWDVLDIAGTSVEALQRALCRARVVVSIDGSHLDHAHLSLRPGSVMVVLMPHDKFSTRQLGICRAQGVVPGMVVLPGSREQGYLADLDEVLRTVDRAEARAQR